MSNQSIMNKNQINSILDLIQKSKKKFFLNYTSKKIVYFCKGILELIIYKKLKN
jgi:hypothetical protein